ncbi:hypothetical protein BOTBODRAFT_31347 [Botryobasidium botryosum FD-172 SS1]|uniref:BAH domain-containing protein n=1 Tax=Botryobasidium botryosum (strain FD-172 SS1) TaxID=930990 RepID=A0A067MK44_BOTB1|nr:hypothetical protein BOTBODRAFT_31347 [Botryobasidium botryosum FD-172 SS1]
MPRPNSKAKATYNNTKTTRKRKLVSRDEDAPEATAPELEPDSDLETQTEFSEGEGIKPPTLAEFKKLKVMKQFQTGRKEGTSLSKTLNAKELKDMRFKVGDDIFVLPQAAEKGEVWAAKIREIRGDAQNKAWLRIVWYYTPTQLKDHARHGKDSALNDYDPTEYGVKELFASDHEDVISHASCDGHARVVQYDENKVDQPQIDGKTYWTRSTFYFGNPGKGKKRFAVPKSCPCGEVYDPARVMRYCPRAACKRWLHERCLKRASAKHYPAGNSKSRDEVFEEMIPGDAGLDTDTEEEEDLDTDADRDGRGEKKGVDDEWRQTIPPELRELARARIVRGGVHGLVGNAHAVLKAREILRTGRVPRDWEAVVGHDVLRSVQKLQRQHQHQQRRHSDRGVESGSLGYSGGSSGAARKRARVSTGGEREEEDEEGVDYCCLWCNKVI